MSISEFFEDYAAPILSGGLSLVAKKLLPDDIYKTVSQTAQSFAGAQIPDLIYGIEKGLENENSSWLERIAMGADRALDPGGSVDYSLREIGEEIPKSWRQYMQPAGTTIGGIVGSYIPVIGTAAGAAIGSGIGSKLGGDPYAESFIKSGLAYGTSAIGKAFSGVGKEAAGAGLQGQMAGDSMFGGFDASALGDLSSYGVDTGMTAAPLDTAGTVATDSTESMFNLNNIMKVLDMAGSIGKSLVSAPQQQASEMTPYMWSNPLYIPEDMQPYRSTSGEKGVSGAGKSALFEDYGFKKKKNYADLALMLKDFEEEKKNEYRQSF